MFQLIDGGIRRAHELTRATNIIRPNDAEAFLRTHPHYAAAAQTLLAHATRADNRPAPTPSPSPRGPWSPPPLLLPAGAEPGAGRPGSPLPVAGARGPQSVVLGLPLQFHGVHFAYPLRPDKEVLRGLNLSIEPGTLGVCWLALEECVALSALGTSLDHTSHPLASRHVLFVSFTLSCSLSLSFFP